MNENRMMEYTGIGLPEDIRDLRDAGWFEEAEKLINMRLEGDLPDCIRQDFLAQREMMRRLPLEFTYTKEEALDLVRSKVPGFTAEELEHHIEAGRITWHFVEGRMMLIDSFFDNMVKEGYFRGRLPDDEPKDIVNHELMNRFDRLERCARIMAEKGSMDADITFRHSIRINDGDFVPGKTYRVWLPIAAKCLQQSGIKLLRASQEPTFVSPEDADQRTVYFEEKMEENHPFEIEYSYHYHAPYIDPFTVTPSSEQPRFDTEEIYPHIVFTPLVRALCEELSKGASGPVEKAWRFYDYITTKCPYSFVTDYICQESIASSGILNRRGDCGVLALGFITLCRCAGIPARWQSGLVADPFGTGCHDWAQFYVAPYGWMFADCSFGGTGYRQGSELRHRFYFGNLDIYRNVTTGRFQADLVPSPLFFRNDPYDNQTGEVQTEDGGLTRRSFGYTAEVTGFEEK